GESLGITGYNKSGKTTIADLLIKIINPKSGNILINNCDINKVSTKYLRGIVTYIPKYACLLDSTIEDNIIYPEIMDEYRYNDALNKCQLKELLMSLPNRDHELIRNIDLSKEEQTKIALASAIYKDSPIMVLDEATISLSEEKEKEILKEFYKLKNKIVIVINNHFSALENCDKIMIINKGKIVEYGDKDALVSNKRSVYSKMIKSDQKQAI
ncbi:MAG: ABC transporter ATP-binding protein, partial [Bacilli bacterium]